MNTKSIQQKTDKSNRTSKHRLDLIEEKQAFVVIALTDKLSRNAKDVAFNTLAHYNSRLGYSYATLPTIARECGMSVTSVKAVRKAFEEISDVGAFEIIKRPPTKGSKKSGAHHCCPNMPWFRAEYKLLQKSDQADAFEDMREQNAQGLEPHQTGLQAPSDRVGNPIRQGCEPYKENRTKRTDVNEKIEERKEERADGAFPGVVFDEEQTAASNPANDNEGRWPANGFDQYWVTMPKRTYKDKSRKAFDRLAASGDVGYKDFMREAKAYNTYSKSITNPTFVLGTLSFIENGRYKDNWSEQVVAKRSKRAMAI